MIGEVSPKDASAIFDEGGAILLDVRTAEEFANGHPAGSWNIPVMSAGPRGMQPNPDFLAVVQAAVPKDRKVLVSCMSGQRSMRACQIMAESGYQDLANVSSGYGGKRDMFGRTTEPGWLALNLPIESGQPRDRSYDDLKKKAGV
ncbi:rhodanese-like domain-containing protein [bacterium]|nr:rhodanese-like domain-containing protein [bacterium]